MKPCIIFLTLLLSLFVYIFSAVRAASPCYTDRPVPIYYSASVCSCHRWWPWSRHCTHYRYVTRVYYKYSKRCCPGYTGSDCSQPICNCQHGGTCVAPNVCRCPPGYGGNSCQTPLCNPQCRHGHCSRPNQCTCYGGYKGTDCSTPDCNPPCQNGGYCRNPNFCQCSTQYSGPHCRQPVCNPPCLNGGTCASPPSTCHCILSKYEGPQCQKPICNPPCANNGTCVSPSTCSCLQTYTGGRCEKPLCSHHSPCFPGNCSDTINCQCNNGFTGDIRNNRCKTLDINNIPTITKASAFLANIERTGEKRELYRFMTDSSEPNSTEIDKLWLSEKDYNYVNADFTAIYVPEGKYELPDYVENYTFGIVEGKMRLDLHKVDRRDPDNPFISLNSSIYHCSNQPGSLTPNTSVYACNITHENFDRLLEDGDNLTLTVIAVNGGFRKLVAPTFTVMDPFIGQPAEKSMMFRFDFRKPVHCLFDDNPCSKIPFNVTNDVTKSAIKFYWDGWDDVLSGIGHYKIEEFFLQPNPNNNLNLNEPDPWSPMNVFTFLESSRNFTRVPAQPGMYSYILNVIDRANNTQYARSLVLYDPKSSITTYDTSPMIATSAAEETNYKWQNNLTNPISVSWKSHFRNDFLESNKLLRPVTPYKYHNFYVNFQKAVPDDLEDKDGKRTLKGITNAHGVVKFQYTYRHSNQGNDPPDDWKDPTDNFMSQTASFNVIKQNGDSLNVWVKAIDILGNEKIDMMQIYFDETPPDNLEEIIFIKNIENSTFPFSSRLIVDTRDTDSGIYGIKYRFTSNNTGAVFKSDFIPGNKSNVALSLKEGYMDQMGDYFYYSHYLEVDNCWMVVTKDAFKNEFVNLELIVYNRALVSTRKTYMITDLGSLNGIDEYSGPTNLHVETTYSNAVRLRWTVSPTCYEKTKITVSGVSKDGKRFLRSIHRDRDYLDVNGLEAETTYNLSFVTEYGDQKSDPIFLTFHTIESPAALTAGGIAGISTVIVFLLAIIIAGVIMWRTGRLSVAKQGMQRRMTVVRNRIQQQISARYVPYEDQDDIYLYGQMEVNKSDGWVIPHVCIVLESLFTSGKFADIYKIRYQPKKCDSGRNAFVAKVLKSGASEEDRISMRAKINFYASKVGEHPNILHFMGAVFDDETLGPYMVLEFCEVGQLNSWLHQQKNTANEETSEQLCRICYGICKGMLHLESRKLVHRRLAARNVLLTSELEPKIYGFCPQQQEAEGENKDDDGDVKEDKSRIPVKWTAPECLVTMKHATPKSDVWSFGVVLSEIFSFGEIPYPSIRSRDVQAHLRNGNRMDKPEFANDFFYDIMKQCWKMKPKQRPSFRDMTADIGKTFNSAPSDDFYYYSEKH
nr:uncharacterized protein LOC105320732 isoform X2 [Crassostrea gigas]